MISIIAPTNWKLRKAIIITNQLLEKLKLKQHPDKTYIGKAIKGVDFLGFHITPYITGIASTSIIAMKQNIVRLYERNTSIERIGQYLKNWSKWFNSMIPDYFNKLKTSGIYCTCYPMFLKTCLGPDRTPVFRGWIY